MQAATLSLLEALDYSQQDEAELACKLMKDCNSLKPSVRAKLQQAFLTGICQATDLVVALSSFQQFPEQAEQQPQLYSTVLERLACTSGMQL